MGEVASGQKLVGLLDSIKVAAMDAARDTHQHELFTNTIAKSQTGKTDFQKMNLL